MPTDARPKRNYQRQLPNYLSSTTTTTSKQDMKLIALSTVSTIHLVIITVKRTSVFVDRGGNYRCVRSLCPVRSTVLQVITAIIIAVQTGAYVNCRPTLGQTGTKLIALSTRAVRSAITAVHSTVYFVSKKTAFHIFASTRVSESNDALIYTKAYVL